MDAVPALRGALRCAIVAAAAAAGVGGTACATTPREGPQVAVTTTGEADGEAARGVANRASSEIVTGGDPAAVHARIAGVLAQSGHDCKTLKDRVACAGDSMQGAAFYVVYREYPARLLFASPWMLKEGCNGALVAVNEFNWTYDELSASCDQRGALIISGAYFVPEGGLSGRDVLGFARWWSLAEVRALSASKIAPLLR